VIRLGLTAAVISLVAGGLLGKHKWFSAENLWEAGLLGVSASVGQGFNSVVTPSVTLIGDTRLMPSIWAGVAFTIGAHFVDGKEWGHMGMLKEFGMGFGISYLAEICTYANGGDGIIVTLKNAVSNAGYANKVEQPADLSGTTPSTSGMPPLK